MTEHASLDKADGGAYRIGAAARLTGISTHTLRKWEHRYRLVQPERTPGGERLYSATDVKRLALVKQLAAGGMPLSQLASLGVDDLETLAGRARGTEAGPAAPGSPTVRTAVVGAALPTLLEQGASQMRRMRVVGDGVDAAEVQERLAGAPVDVLAIEVPVVDASTRDLVASSLDALAARAAIVLYGFGARADVDALRGRHVALLRAPADIEEIERLGLGLMATLSEAWAPQPVSRPLADDTPVSPPRWDARTLVRVSNLSSSIACECPRHLSDLIMSLASFEEYSATCESRNDDDVALHHFLRVTTATCRALMEDALARVAIQEGIELD